MDLFLTGLGVLFIIHLPCIILSCLIAKAKGYNTGDAWICGLLFGLWAVIYYCAVPVLGKGNESIDSVGKVDSKHDEHDVEVQRLVRNLKKKKVNHNKDVFGSFRF